MIPERMTRACAVSIMNACLHELVWVLRASGASAWRLESTTQQQWCTGYEPGDCCCSRPASAKERLLSRRWFCTTCSSARSRFETAPEMCAAAHDSWAAHILSSARSGRTVASASVPRRGTGTNRCFSQFTATYAWTPPGAGGMASSSFCFFTRPPSSEPSVTLALVDSGM